MRKLSAHTVSSLFVAIANRHPFVVVITGALGVGLWGRSPVPLYGRMSKPDGTIGEFTLSPEILSFGCGYSARLVVNIFNKLVEKGSKSSDSVEIDHVE